MYKSLIIIYIFLNLNFIAFNTHSNATIIAQNISTYNILVHSLSTLLDTKTMIPFAKILSISATSNLQNKQMMKDLTNAMAVMHQARWYQFVDLTVHQFYVLKYQRSNLMMFDELDGMR